MITINRWVTRYLGYLVGALVAATYLLDLFESDIGSFVTIAASLLVVIAAFSGLSFGLASVIETPKDKATAANAGEKFFFATHTLGLSAIAGLGAHYLQDANAIDSISWLMVSGSWALRFSSVLFLGQAIGAMCYGHAWISDLFFRRWQRRLKGLDEETEAEEREALREKE